MIRDHEILSDELSTSGKGVDGFSADGFISSVDEIIEEAKNGRMFIVVDDEDRENEGDLTIPAQMATPDAINFMAMHGRGLICLALDRKRVEALNLEPMSRNNAEKMQTAFTTSIEAKEGVTTGISAADRARTISVAIDAGKGVNDIVTPGHVFPLAAHDGGVLARAGHTEAAVDIARLAGINPSGVICEIMNEDGTMARLDDLIPFARRHGLKIGTIRDLIAYRRRYDHLVRCTQQTDFVSNYGGNWIAKTYRDSISTKKHIVLQKGKIVPGRPTLVRMHNISVVDDVLGKPGSRNQLLQRSMEKIGKAGHGLVVILLPMEPDDVEFDMAGQRRPEMELRSYGIGAQILADIGVEEMILLTNKHQHVVAIEAFGLSIVGEEPVDEN